MRYQPDPPPLNADPVLGNYLHRELQKLAGLFQADRTTNLEISDYAANLLNDQDATEARATLDIPAALLPYQLIPAPVLWTPIYKLSTPGTSAFTYSSIRHGRYIRINKQIFAFGRITTDNVVLGTGTGNLLIGGFPFPARTGAGMGSGAYHGNFFVSYSGGFTTQAPRGGYFNPSSTDVQLAYWATAVAMGAMSQANLVTGAIASQNDIIFLAIYETD